MPDMGEVHGRSYADRRQFLERTHPWEEDEPRGRFRRTVTRRRRVWMCGRSGSKGDLNEDRLLRERIYGRGTGAEGGRVLRGRLVCWLSAMGARRQCSKPLKASK